jgi:quercetin dioxygenase-like cupin family protein
MFKKHSPEGYSMPIPGISMKTICYGGLTLMTEFLLEQESALPMHSHPYEQTGYLISGHIRLTIGEREYDASPGDSWCIPMDVEHGARIIEDSVAVEVFSPVRKDYLPKD